MSNPDRGSQAPAPPSLLQSLKRYLGTWVEVLRTRLDLITNELEEERERVQQVLILAVVTCFCLGLAAVLITFFLVVVFWDHREAVVGGLAVLYLAAGVIAGLAMRQKVRQKSRLFSATLGELAKDSQHLSS